jgi:F0F1-type ATP synthase assembly protein I
MADERSDAAHPDQGHRDQPLRGRDLIGLGGLLVGSVVLCTVLGLVLDRSLDSSPAFTLTGVGVGIVLAGVGFWVRIRSALRG